MAYNKYKLYKQQVSYDGVTWMDVTPSQTACGGAPIETYNTLAECEYEPIIYYALDRLNVRLSAFTPAATAETFSNGVGKIKFVENVTAIGQGAFSGMSLTSIVLPNSITELAYGAFAHCTSLSSIDIPSGVTSINSRVFYNCWSLTSVTIPSGVTGIGSNAFYYCSSLTSVTCLATTPPEFGRILPFGNTNDCPIYVPCESVEAYKTAWSAYASRIQAIP